MSETGAGAVYAGGPTSVQNIIPSYLYTEYADDDALQAFVAGFNVYAQQFLAWMNNLNLPIYTGGIIENALLDWVATGLYGISRPVFQTGMNKTIAPYNSYAYNRNAYNRRKVTSSTTYTLATDDIYRRVITWNFYKGDGMQYNTVWLKKRISRFLGVSPANDNTYQVSVTYSGSAVTILLPHLPISSILQAAVSAGVVNLPFEYTYSVNVS